MARCQEIHPGLNIQCRLEEGHESKSPHTAVTEWGMNAVWGKVVGSATIKNG